MKKIILICLITLCFCLTGCSNNQNQSNFLDYTAYRTEISDIQTDNQIEFQKDMQKVETDLSSFSTKIYTPNDEARQNNISITCSNLNGKIINPGETFSFCETVGKATPDRGYQKADIFDKDGNTIKGYGGGNCQISSTLYNAILELPSLSIVERHQHSKKVYYVPLGKDAAVAYGSIDFKFRNDYDYSIKIYCSNTRDSIDVRIVKI